MCWIIIKYYLEKTKKINTRKQIRTRLSTFWFQRLRIRTNKYVPYLIVFDWFNHWYPKLWSARFSPVRIEQNVLVSMTLKEDCSHDLDSIGNIKSVLVGSKSNVCLLLTLWCDKSVNFSNLDFVKTWARFFDHLLVSSLVDHEYKGVVVLDGFDGRLTAQWMFNASILVESIIFFHSSQDILWSSGLM